jgi:crossover junction endodeoxyribonuclease RuvC
MSSNFILGIDIGLRGAVAILKDGVPIAAVPMPVLSDGPAGRNAVNGPLLAKIVADSHAGAAYIEHVGPRPGEGAVSAFCFGRSKGITEGVLAALSVRVDWLTPPVWKRIIGLPPGREGAKDRSRAEAIRRWPHLAALFARKGDDGLAEACLIGAAGLMLAGLR